MVKKTVSKQIVKERASVCLHGLKVVPRSLGQVWRVRARMVPRHRPGSPSQQGSTNTEERHLNSYGTQERCRLLAKCGGLTV